MRNIGHAIGGGFVAGLLTLAVASAQAAVVNASVHGTVTSGSDFFALFGTGSSDLTGQAITIGFGYDTATIGAGGVFAGGANFLNPFVTINGVTLTLSDHLAPTAPTTVTLVDGAPDTFAVDYAINATECIVFPGGGFQSCLDKLESLVLDVAGTTDFLSGVATLPASIDVAATGTGGFGFFYLDECFGYVCPPSFVSGGASFAITRLVVGDGAPIDPPPPIEPDPIPAAVVMEPGTLGTIGLGLLGYGALARRQSRRGSRSFGVASL